MSQNQKKAEENGPNSRRSFLSTAGRLTMAGAVAPVIGLQAPPALAEEAQPSQAELPTNGYLEATAQRSLSALESAYGAHEGQRRNHTKGIGAIGKFVGTSAAREYSRSLLFSGETIEVVARFSLAGGDPDASDAERSARGIGLQFRLPDGSLQHMTMLHTPIFFATMPQTFIDKFFALTPDVATGKPDPARFREFLRSHSDNDAQAHYLGTVNPPISYANCQFFGIHTFKFISGDAKVSMVRWRFVPRDGAKNLTDDEVKNAPRDFLQAALVERVKRGPIQWDMIVSIGELGDSVTNPTVLWPENRKEFNAGILTLTDAMPQELAPSYGINFDPLVMADGIEPSDDPILRFRSPSYGLSYSRRLREL
ncbi:catalase family peroxidase [Paraburkholderia solisilvae]|uniref:Catalase-related peroxidase n=1 Tax=Paraburkholderia solisilvae TaxID=624376 RepID=A0A6J5ELU0_9BURK|nr:catalase family peroxidase [Paraburkholderia solisilvae]CAB3767489.1 Catalase-related peroxidase [Paraburkholderia solisilvae]